MKSLLYFIAFTFMFFATDTFGQCGRISLIGEFNSWSSDEFLDRDPVDPEEFSLVLVLTPNDDSNGDGIIEMKFRENTNWTHNWGSTQFPSGNGILNGPNIPVPVGSYLVTFNCNNLHYNFQSTCGQISLIGEFNGWVEDYWMTRNLTDPDEWSVTLPLNAASDVNGDGIVEMKFRMNSDWGTNWGTIWTAPEFPSGTGVPDGGNILVPLTSSGISTDFIVTFNCETFAYNFIETSGPISLYGEFSDWTGDFYLEMDEEQFNLFSGIISINVQDDYNGDGIVEMKFRENDDNTINWGSTQFPSGTAVLNGANIQVPLDNSGITTDYMVSFNYASYAFSFQATSGAISIIGAFIGWNGDIPMNREPETPDIWKITRCWYDDSDLKFRENLDWNNNWGNLGWPSGTAVWNGPNIPLIAGTYDVTFNTATGAYSFVDNPDACGEIGMVGDFNDWGVGAGGYPSDVYLLRDPVYPSRFSIDYFFNESTGLLFRLNADPDFTDVWGGTSLCQTGVQDESAIIAVDAGNYHITFDYNSGDYCMTRLDNSVTAPKTFSMNIDGTLDEPEWEQGERIMRIIDGIPGEDVNEAYFGVVYSDDFLYVGLTVTDAILTINDAVSIFVDGDQSGGNYDLHDVYFIVNGSVITIINGPPGGITIDLATTLNVNGFVMEMAIPWSALGVIPAEGGKAGFDIIIGDDDSGVGVEYQMAWNGSLVNELSTSGFGELIFGPMFFGSISMYHPVIGDIILRNPSNQPETYTATYDFDDDFGVVFRKDKANSYSWGATDFPTGIAELGGPSIPVAEGRYRINFNLQTGEYIFDFQPAGENVAMANFNDEPPVIDGQLDEYDLFYNSNILATGGGPINNVVNWGAIWDMENLYIGVRVTDGAMYGTGNPWDNDAIEFFIDGNNDKDGPYDPDFDTQIIMDIMNQSVPWFKADGVPVTNYNAQWIYTDLGYNVEIRLGWDNFDFEPGRGRVMGWSLANNDNDYNAGRDYQSTWYGNVNNWNNTYNLGDLQLADGPYTVNIAENLSRESILIYPNPSNGQFYIRLTGKELGDHFRIHVTDVSGRIIGAEIDHSSGDEIMVRIKKGQSGPGLYIVHIYSDHGDFHARKLIIH
jgi:hypothetical protein